MKKHIVYIVMSLLSVTGCVESEIDTEALHYKTGAAAFTEVENALDAIFVPLDKSLAIEAFADYLENNRLADGSNLLDVWLDAEDLYFPENRVRNSGDRWFVLSGADTLYSIDTGGKSLFTTGSLWRFFEDGIKDCQIVENLGESAFGYTLSGYLARIDREYYYNRQPIDAELRICFNGSGISTATLESDFSLSGSLEIYNNTYYSYWGSNKDGYREVRMTANFPESTPLIHKYYSNTFRIFSAGRYTINIEDITMEKTDQVNVSIVSLFSHTREVTVTFRGDTVVF